MLLKALPKVLHILVHQLKVGNPFVKLFPCHIVAGMEKQGNRPGLLADEGADRQGPVRHHTAADPG